MIKILDMYCGAGGASMGYHMALKSVGVKHEIVGVDIRHMPRYPFDFIQCDALSLNYEFLYQFDFIHASPPCKAYTRLYRFSVKDTDKTVLPRTLTTLEALAIPYVTENVPQAPIRADIQLDGTMFDLLFLRRRIFQTNMRIEVPYPKRTLLEPGKRYITIAGNSSTLEAASNAMGIDWMTKAELNEAVPPAYTRWIAEQVFTREFKK